jgi:hypothetical protein
VHQLLRVLLNTLYAGIYFNDNLLYYINYINLINFFNYINCIKFVTQFHEIDKFIIGVDNFSQLTTIVNVLKNINYDNKIEYNLKLNNNKIIDPRFW